jgi:transcriptional regulator with XRE-family HTH domain
MILAMKPDDLKARREALKLTQDQLARELGIDVMTVSRWERGARSIPPYLSLAIETVERRQAAARSTAGRRKKR